MKRDGYTMDFVRCLTDSFTFSRSNRRSERQAPFVGDAAGGLRMKAAEIISVPLTISPGFGWRWRSQDDKHESPEWFVFHRDCAIDAQRNGYAVVRTRIERAGHQRTAKARSAGAK